MERGAKWVDGDALVLYCSVPREQLAGIEGPVGGVVADQQEQSTASSYSRAVSPDDVVARKGVEGGVGTEFCLLDGGDLDFVLLEEVGEFPVL